ncbi:hypothetical protein HOY80DRAFT_860703, partial [Tuber brumale]
GDDTCAVSSGGRCDANHILIIDGSSNNQERVLAIQHSHSESIVNELGPAPRNYFSSTGFFNRNSALGISSLCRCWFPAARQPTRPS